MGGDGEKFLSTHHERDIETGLDNRGARFYDAEVGRFLSLDPAAEKYEEWSAYNYVFARPSSVIDPDGKDGWDVIKGFANAVMDNLGAADKRADYRPESGKDYNLGQNIGDAFSIIGGAEATILGLGMMGGSGTLEVASVGTLTPVAGAGFLIGAFLTVKGGEASINGARNLVSQKGRVGDTNGSNREGKDFTKKGKEEVKKENASRNNGVNKCENCGNETVDPKKHTKGVKPPGNETHVDHVTPKAKGGGGTPKNGQVLCRDCNLDKGSK